MICHILRDAVILENFFLQHMPGFFFHAKCKTINKNEFEIKEIEMFSKELVLFTS